MGGAHFLLRYPLCGETPQRPYPKTYILMYPKIKINTKIKTK